MAPSDPTCMPYPTGTDFPPPPVFYDTNGEQPPAYDSLHPEDKGHLAAMELHSLGGPLTATTPYQMPSATSQDPAAMPPPPVVMGTEGTSHLVQIPPPPYEG